ncbi:hypothetical protein V6N13_041022 [Hibiscus sabdariffa]
MEGLIPLVYRTLKKAKTRRQYECLSAGAAQAYNIADFYVRTPGSNQTHFSGREQYRQSWSPSAHVHGRYL